MKKKWMTTLCIICTIGLVGCQVKSADEKNQEQPSQESEQKAEDLKKPVTIEQQQTVVEIVDPTTKAIIQTISPKEMGYERDKQSYTKQIEQLAKELARGNEKAAGYDKRMILDKLDDQEKLMKGSPLIVLKESELVERILEASATGGKVEMPLYITESGYYFEDIPYLENVVVASYTTYFNTDDVGRNKNIELSAKAINNVIVGSGDYFSFNTVVGPRDEANGYQPAPEIINKKVVMGIGGGICQTSSTLFNAVDQIPVKFVERHHHSLDVGYVPKGRDATVSYGGLDFRFHNTSDVPFLIKANYNKNSLTVEVRTAEKFVKILKKS
ncbi:VanW family protein [Lysinibacillus sphaericus]|nr:VanW family protein [Lysinibacillus sphaericus]MBG9454032.1 VanW family protein [Lysinibacillus sphaericus]MBG9478449.1 VanW family protein [Lysinibacillus sphaericus]MBG9592098.1 VanW family protein [Lysinibacillus sphaericus]